MRLTVDHTGGIHARPSMAIATTVRKHDAKVQVQVSDRIVDASQVIELLTLGAPQGSELVFTARGAEADQVLAALAELFTRDFDM